MKFYQRVGWDFIEVFCLKRHISQFNQVFPLSIINSNNNNINNIHNSDHNNYRYYHLKILTLDILHLKKKNPAKLFDLETCTIFPSESGLWPDPGHTILRRYCTGWSTLSVSPQ